MPSITRRGLLAGATALPLVTIRTRPARAAEFTYKLGTNLPATHPLSARNIEAAARIKEATGGQLEINVFPSSQLGTDTDMLSQVRSGGVEFFTLSPLILSTLVPAASINGMGYVFPNYDAVWAAMDGQLGAWVRAQIAKNNLVAMDKIWDNGFRQTTSSTKPITRPDDLINFRIRVPPSPLWTSLYRTFGAAPTSINLNETYSALQTRIVDGQENALALIATVKLYEVQKYCSMTNHMWDGYWFLANRRAWERLPRDLREIVAEEINAAGMKERADVAKLNAELQAELTAKGLLFNTPDPEPFRDKLRAAGFYKEWKGRYGPEGWALLEKTSGKLV